MTSRNSVIWSEGLFVKPQHFQQQARALEHHANQRINAVSEHLYGFSVLELNHEYLSFGKIAIVMPDGTVFNIPNDQPPPAPLTIADATSAGQVVYLTLPLKSDGVLEVQWPDTYANARYIAHSEEARDTHSEEGDHIRMDLAIPNLQLTLERDDRSAFTGIALCHILDKRPDGSLVLDEHSYPTSVSLSAVPRHLPFHSGFSYFQLDRSHANWQMMREAAGFGFHIAGDYPELEMQFWAIRSQ